MGPVQVSNFNGRAMIERNDRIFVLAMLLPTFLFIILFYGYPTVFNMLNSFSDLSLLNLRQGGEFIGLDNYRELFNNKSFERTLWNTVYWLTFLPIVLRMLLGLGLALLLNASVIGRFRLTTVTRLCLVVPWATPPIVAVVTWRWLMDGSVGAINKYLLEWGLIDRPIAFLADPQLVWPSLVLIMIWNTLPFVTITLLAALQSIPKELLEAAEVDGAGYVDRLFHVVLPHLKPTLVVLVLMLTFFSFNNFVYVWLATGAGPGLMTNVLATEIYIRAFVDLNLGLSSAVGMVMAAFMIVVTYFYYRHVATRQFKEIF